MVLALSSGGASPSMAQEQVQLLSAAPVVQQVCQVVQEVAPQGDTGTGALLGTVAGGVAGNRFGSGEGRALATLFGVLLGALWGERIEGRPAPQMQQVRHCTLRGVLPQALPLRPGSAMRTQPSPPPIGGADDSDD